MTHSAEAEVSFTPDVLRVRWPDGCRDDFPSLWLRDNRSVDRDAGSGQRLVDIADIPPAPRIRSVAPGDGGIRIEWDDGEPPAVFAWGWLATALQPPDVRRPELRRRTWLEGGALDPMSDFAWAEFTDFAARPAVRFAWLTRLAQDGVAFLRGVPATDRAILMAAERMGLVAQTNYGLLFDVRSVARPENLAYSDLGLGLHTDNPYREPVPGFQALHVLVASPDGGDSIFADGVGLAEHLRRTDPEAFSLLAQTPVPFYYRSPDADLYADRPLIQLSPQGEVRAVHYNNRSIAPFNPTAVGLGAFYAAYRRFALLLRDERFQVRLRLADGEMVAFDNQRTLHGRTAYTSARHPRHLQGCYLTRDSVLSQIGLLRRELAGSAAP